MGSCWGGWLEDWTYEKTQNEQLGIGTLKLKWELNTITINKMLTRWTTSFGLLYLENEAICEKSLMYKRGIEKYTRLSLFISGKWVGGRLHSFFLKCNQRLATSKSNLIFLFVCLFVCLFEQSLVEAFLQSFWFAPQMEKHL
jgi:hypothetical protein